MRYQIYLICFFSATSLFAQNQNKQLLVDSGIVYNNFYAGGSTAAISNYSFFIDSITNVIITKISKNYLDTLSIIFSNIKQRKHFQQKIGPVKYARIYISGKDHRLVFIENWGIIDFSENPIKQLNIVDTKYKDIFQRFIEFYWH
jgi:hypothetical protein